MLMSLSELERMAYIRGRTFLARAYAAADDNAMAATKAHGVLADEKFDATRLPISELPVLLVALQEARDAAEENEIQLHLEI